MRERFLGPSSSPFTSRRFHLRPSARTHTHTRIYDIHVHITRALVLTRTAGTLKDAETRNRLQLDSTSRPAGRQATKLGRGSKESCSLSLSRRFSSLFSPGSLAHRFFLSSLCGFAFYASPNCSLYTLATNEKGKRTSKEEKCVY